MGNLVNEGVFIRGQSRAAIRRDVDVLSFRQAESETLPRQLSNGVRDLGNCGLKTRIWCLSAKRSAGANR